MLIKGFYPLPVRLPRVRSRIGERRLNVASRRVVEVKPMRGHFPKYFGINVKGTLFTVQKALPLMPSCGNIVINGSMVSIKGIPAFGVSAATKAALRSFARTWAVDLKGSNIRVNIIAPGTIVTLGYKSELGLSDEQIEDFKAQAAATTPLGRTGVPEEVAAAVLFLASDESSYVNGVESRANLKVQSNAILVLRERSEFKKGSFQVS